MLLELGHVLVAYGFEASDEGGRVLEAPNAHHDVYNRLRREPGHSGAPYVLDLLHPGADGTFDMRPLLLEERRPSLLVRDHDYGIFTGHAAKCIPD